jgi:hypothetical protein
LWIVAVWPVTELTVVIVNAALARAAPLAPPPVASQMRLTPALRRSGSRKPATPKLTEVEAGVYATWGMVVDLTTDTLDLF